MMCVDNDASYVMGVFLLVAVVCCCLHVSHVGLMMGVDADVAANVDVDDCS